MSDLISRQAAIDAFQNLAYDDWNQGVSTSWADAFTECAEIISGLPCTEPEQTCGYWDSEGKFCALYRPAAQQEQKTGRWIEQDDGWDGKYYV